MNLEVRRCGGMLRRAGNAPPAPHDALEPHERQEQRHELREVVNREASRDQLAPKLTRGIPPAVMSGFVEVTPQTHVRRHGHDEMPAGPELLPESAQDF